MTDKVIPIGFTKKQPLVQVDDSELIGMYECQGCSEVYSSEKGESGTPPLCVNCSGKHDMLFLGLAVE